MPYSFSMDPAGSTSEEPTTVAQRLINATIDVIDSEGEAAVRVLSIVETVGVPIPVLYRQFGNRDGLVQAAQSERLIRDLRAELNQINARLDATTCREEFEEALIGIARAMMTPDRAEVRLRRMSAIGSAYGRPDLTAEIAGTLEESVAAIASMLLRPKALGWLRDDLEVDTFAAWYAGQMLGRVIIEVGNSRVDRVGFDQIQIDAIRWMLFG